VSPWPPLDDDVGGGEHDPVCGHPAQCERTTGADHHDSIPHEKQQVQVAAKCKKCNFPKLS
jgi:C4-type Zn-finger protein